jgi:hypothetical protein
MLSPASTRIRVFPVDSSAAFPVLPLANTQNLTIAPPDLIRIHLIGIKQNGGGMFSWGEGRFDAEMG